MLFPLRSAVIRSASRSIARWREIVGHENRVARDHRQQVVEVVGDPAGELPDGFHLLRMPDLLLQGPQHRLGPPTDVSGLGAILFELLAGRPPFEGGRSAMAIVRQVLMDEPRWPSSEPRSTSGMSLMAACRAAVSR